jgi:carbon monoxide dehydrogenase subunit G
LKITITHLIAADRERVFDALVDPAVMQRCIPGVESMIETAPDTYDATLKIGIAGLKGTYTGRTTIANKLRPDSLTLGLEGKGAPGFVRGTAAIALSSVDGRTQVACDADVQVGGLIAAVGSRLVEAAARKMAADFFSAFERQVSAG